MPLSARLPLPAFLLGALLPLPALACPTELGAGLVYTNADGTRTEITPTGQPGVQRDRTLLADGTYFELLAHHGLFDIESADLDPSGTPVAATRTSTTYATPPALPGPGDQVLGVMARATSAGAPVERRLDAVAGPLGEVAFGDCRYQGYPIALRVYDPDGPFVDHLVRVPSLGTTFYVGYEDQSGRADYAVTGIAALPPGAN